MKVGMNLFLWTDKPEYDKHAKIIELIKKIGFDGVEFPVPLIETKDIEKFVKLCHELGLETTAVATIDPSIANPCSSDEKLREASIPLFEEWFDKTEGLGASLLSGPFFQALGTFTGKRRTEDEWKYSLDVCHRAFQIAADRNIEIALEPLNRFEMYFVNTLSEAKRFVKELKLPNVGLLGDTMHSNIEELDTVQAYVNSMPYLKHVHVSESTRGTPGSGHAIPEDFFTRIGEKGYDGYCTIEAFEGGTTPSMIPALHLWTDSPDTPEELARKGFKFIKSHMPSAV